MIRSPLLFSLCIVLLRCLGPSSAAVTVLRNANVYTVDENNPRAEAIAIQDGIILAVGTNNEIDARYPVAQRNVTYDLGGRLVLPGFHDAHLHAVEAGVNNGLCVIDPQTPIEDVPFIFADCPNGGQFADQGWIVGAGIDVATLLGIIDTDVDAEYPITVLDRSFPTIPVLILDSLGHGAVANSVAMQAVGYHELRGNPPGGIIIRDPFTGELTGIVLENAQQRLRDMAFPPTQANSDMALDSLFEALDVFAINGITTVSDAGGFWRQAQIRSWSRAEEMGFLTVRTSNALYIYPDEPFDEQLPKLLERYSNDSSRLTRFNQAKIYVDGILSLSTGALYDPYETSRELSPQLRFGFEYFTGSKNLTEISQILSSNGFQLHFHVTGDRGAGLALDAIAASDPSSGPHRLTHCFLVDERDRNRFASMGAVADFQLAPSSVTQASIDFISDIIGSARASRLLPAMEIFDTGAPMVISSDYDADEISPLIKIQTMLTRTTGQRFPNVETVIPFMTRDSAALLHTNTGTIEAGKFADLIALDRNIFNISVDAIGQARVVLTMFNGEIIHDPDNIGVPFSAAPPRPAICFSGNNLVTIHDRGVIPIGELKVNDKVLVADGVFERVYSFGHWHETLRGEFLQIHVDGLDRPLEISRAHMMFLEGNAVPASLVKMGDVVELMEGKLGKVIAIKEVIRQGVYAPFTPSGTIIVNGVKASTYVAFQNSKVLQIGKMQTVFTHQWLDHTALMPLRMYCSIRLCSESFDEMGLSNWIKSPLDFAIWWFSQDVIVIGCLVPVVICILFLFALLEIMFQPWFAGVIIFLIGLWQTLSKLGCFDRRTSKHKITQ